MQPIGKGAFPFLCHEGLACFAFCCRRVDIVLYAYDILRMKTRLGLTSDDFLDRFAKMTAGDHPLPRVMLRMAENTEHTCPFLGESGCTIYADRPTDCRTYPLERAVDRDLAASGPRDYYFVHRADHCLGHSESREWTVREWIENQEIELFNRMNDLWVEADSLIRRAVLPTDKNSEQRQKMAFMVCYNLDMFRRFLFESTFLKRFNLPQKTVNGVKTDDIALLKFGVDWLRFFLGFDKTLTLKVLSRRLS